MDRIRHWLWLDRTQRTDNSEANRGFYPGGHPVYVNRKPVGWRFTLVVVAIGIVIALLIIAVRDADAQATDDGQRLVFEEPGFAVTLPADWEVETPEPHVWEPCHEVMWAAAGRGGVWDGDQTCRLITTRCSLSRRLGDPPRLWSSEIVAEWLDLPIGRVLYIQEQSFPPIVDVQYRVPHGMEEFVIACMAEQPPEDRWRSIAETFEVLRDEREVIVPTLALAMVFPDDWTVLEDQAPVAGAKGWQNLLWASDGHSACRLQADTGGRDARVSTPGVDDRAALRDWLDARRADVLGSTEVDLPIGPAQRTDWIVGWWEGRMPHSTYEFESAGVQSRFVCRAESPPDDRWLSLAEGIAPVDDGGPG